MEYLLEIRDTKKENLPSAIAKGMKEKYDMDVTVIPALGEIRAPGIDTTVTGFSVRDDNYTGNVALFLAVGYEKVGYAEYRIYGDITPYCPSCVRSFSFRDAGRFCKHCGTKLEYRL